MTAPIDAHKVLMTGEDSFIRLSHDAGGCPCGRTRRPLVRHEAASGREAR